ncbi:DUF6074 family protein [Mesorhizobium sp. B2-7-2]|uniref:DUF6074 family protein n=1 Tax=Mesorhizobium sp. B2-7-2 TaxID=2589908 RepID=UPI0015E437B0|nr:DUF6074 family protein [Mesorhizobium sp. B2-7-2]
MQLELDFNAPLPPVESVGAKITAFPLSRQRSTIQDVALQFKSKRGKKRQTFWQETIARMRTELRAIGMKEDAITRQLIAFRDAVEREAYPRRGDDPQYGGAA